MNGPRYFAGLPVEARRELLRVLTSPSNVRADVIRQFHDRGDEGMVETLAELEACRAAPGGCTVHLRAGPGRYAHRCRAFRGIVPMVGDRTTVGLVVTGSMILLVRRRRPAG